MTLDRSALETLAGEALPDGQVQLSVRATDELGFASPDARLSFQLDTTRPAPPSPPQLLPSSDTGAANFDGITAAETLAIQTGSTQADVEIVLTVDGYEAGRAAGGPAVSFSTSAAEGRLRFTAQALDAAGNASIFSQPLFVTVDRTTEPPAVSLDRASQSFGFDLGRHTTRQQVTLIGTAEPRAVVQLLRPMTWHRSWTSWRPTRLATCKSTASHSSRVRTASSCTRPIWRATPRVPRSKS